MSNASIEEKHKHYRGIAVGYTATIITLSTLQIGWLVQERGKLNFHELNFVVCPCIGISASLSVLILIFLAYSILFSLLSQFFMFRGYLLEAQGQGSVANPKYFSPADKIIQAVMYLFLIGTSGTLIILLGWGAFLVIAPFVGFALYFYRGMF